MIKKLISLLLILSFSLTNIVWAEVIDSIPQKFKSEIKSAIAEVYGKEDCDVIYENVMKIARHSIEERPVSLKKSDETRPDDWYKDEIIYMFYVDQFGVNDGETSSTFHDTTKMFKYLKDLGVTTLYMLPFAESPMTDAGFDVKNPQNVRKDLGGMKEFKEFITKAKQEGFKIKADLVLNHFSEEHEWFKSLQNGDLSKLNYFIVRETMPEYKKYQDEKLGTVVEYVEEDGKISKRRLIFPENTENNWRKITVNGKDYFVYHTFYPFQLDINWENPQVLYYCLQTISYWSNLGIDIFRMDAIPYLSKEPGTNAENQPKTHAIIKLLSNYIQATAPSSVIQVEACQVPKDILPYFGKERTVQWDERELKRTDEAQIAYHFPYMPAIWASLITKDKKYFFDANKATPEIPSTSAWGIFLRVHDELTLEMVSPEIRELIYNELSPKGASFRKGFGVSGRLANFLDNNPNRIEMAFSILLSLPGIPIIYYGDEIGVSNNFANANKSAIKRRIKQRTSKIKLLSAFDSRDIHRGEVPYKLFYGSTNNYYAYNSRVYKKVRNLIHIRKNLPAMTRGEFIPLKTKSPHNFAYIRKDKNQQILVINNLSNEKLIAEIKIPMNIILKNDGHITSLKNLINGDDIRVDVSLTNRTMHLRVAPYGVLWLEL